MKIIHICLSNYYIDGWNYQENCLVREHIRTGHDVTVIASTEVIGEDNHIKYISAGQYVGTEGELIIRLPYRKFLPHLLGAKLRAHPGVRRILDLIKPDAILFHGTCGWELITVSSYIKQNKNCTFYVDSHEDKHNSARNFLSYWFLHKIYYRLILQYSLIYIKKILCYSLESIDFCNSVYKISRDRLEFFPLGGFPLEDTEYKSLRLLSRNRWGASEDQIIIVQLGKLVRKKKLLTSLQAFVLNKNPQLRFYIAGWVPPEDMKEVASFIGSDTRIRYLGWLPSDELEKTLCGADVFLQPAYQTVTTQMSICCRCAVIVEDVLSHKPFVDGNGWLVNPETQLLEIFNQLEVSTVNNMKIRSNQIGIDILDYKKMAQRVLS
jgi:1,2-diacylglycerol 3-alpha-glucosyltransferase